MVFGFWNFTAKRTEYQFDAIEIFQWFALLVLYSHEMKLELYCQPTNWSVFPEPLVRKILSGKAIEDIVN